MPFTVSWLVDKRVTYTRMYGVMTAADLRGLKIVLEEYIAQSEQLIHLISDATDTIRTEMSLKDLQNTEYADATNLGWAIFVNPNMLHRFFASVVTQLRGKRGREFATMEQALEFLQNIDETLPPMKKPEKVAQP